MAHNAQKYRYGNLVVEVRSINTIDARTNKYECLVRGFGHNNPVPRETYIVNAATNAQASRNALQLYIEEYGKK